MICCVSNKETAPVTPPIANEIYIPDFPEPNESFVIPLDSDFHIVNDDETEVMYILIPNWYWNLIIDYKVKITRAVKTLLGKD